MIKTITKRDGRVVPYNREKIKEAILKAAIASNYKEKEFKKDYLEKLIKEVELKINSAKTDIENFTVEDIQDFVEMSLMDNHLYDIAKNYILYRTQHEKYRDGKKLKETMMDVIMTYLDRSNWKVNENSNMGFSLQGLNNHISSEVTNYFWLNEIYPKNIREVHVNGDLHIHDLSSLSVYCCGWDLQDLLLSGFSGVSTKVESKPPKHFGTALMQMVNFLYTLQGEASGAQAFSNFDTYLAPFIHYDNLSYDEVYQAMQEFIFNLNVPTRVGFQTPFTNITMDLVCPSNMKNEPAIIGGKLQDKTLGEFQEEMDMINRAFAEVMLDGDSKGRVFSFPIPTYNITPEFNYNNQMLDPIWEMTAKYGIPYFANFVNSDMKAEDARSMAILGNQNVIYKNVNGRISRNEIRHLVNNWINAGANKPNYQMLMNGKFVDVIDMFEVPYEDTPIYIKLELENGYTQNFSFNHKCAVVRNGEFLEIQSQDIVPGDKFLLSVEGFEGKQIGSYESGKVLGYYLGEGWINNHSNNEIVFAINIDHQEIVNDIKKHFQKMACEVKINKEENCNIFKVHVYGKHAVGFIKNYIKGNKATEKRLENTLWNTSLDFRKGVIDGLYFTDRCPKRDILFHTTNKEIIDDLITLANSVGKILKYRINNKNTRYFKGDKSDLETFTSYELKFYDTNERFTLDGEDYMLVDITKVKELNSRANKVYNFTVNTDRHLYELPNGIITHQCCRLRLDNRQLRKRGGSLFGSNPMTGSIGVVTINMPRIGLLASNKENFIERVYDLMELAKESLEIKRRVLERFTDAGLYPYSQFYLRSIKKRFGNYWQNHFNTIGVNGFNEACLNFLGKDLSDPEAIEFTQWVMDKMLEKMVEFQEETDDLFNLEATPAEGTSYRLAKLDLDRYNNLTPYFANSRRVYGEDADPYYTNSSQLPVSYTDDIFEALELQDSLQSRYTGGTVLHGFIGERLSGIEATKKLVERIAKNFSLPYYSITPTFSICPVHGYLAGEHEYCPKCDVENGYKN